MKENRGMGSLLRYGIVGLAATIAEWSLFSILYYIFTADYIAAICLSFLFSTAVNWALGRALLFRYSEKALSEEMSEIALVSLTGCILNILIVTALKGFLPMLFSKAAATGFVFFYNYFFRTKIIYSSGGAINEQQ